MSRSFIRTPSWAEKRAADYERRLLTLRRDTAWNKVRVYDNTGPFGEGEKWIAAKWPGADVQTALLEKFSDIGTNRYFSKIWAVLPKVDGAAPAENVKIYQVVSFTKAGFRVLGSGKFRDQ